MSINQTLNLWQDIKGDKFELPLSKVNAHPLPARFPRREDNLDVVASFTAPVRRFGLHYAEEWQRDSCSAEVKK